MRPRSTNSSMPPFHFHSLKHTYTSLPTRYQDHYQSTKQPHTQQFIFNCTQNKKCQNPSKKSQKPGVKNRDKGWMETFECGGWMHVTVSDVANQVLVKYGHNMAHMPYCSQKVPEIIEEIIMKNPHLTVDQVTAHYSHIHCMLNLPQC